ncbi:MAG: glutamyl-tRNA reductase [Thermodesulfobacteriota bacterium]
MEIVIMGISHKTAPVEIREKFSVPKGLLSDYLRKLVSLPDVQEGTIISTCNRVEVIAVINQGVGEQELIKFLAGLAQLSMAELDHYLYKLKNAEAVKHVFRVASSLDSMIIGEPQILGQVKEAYRLAVENKTAKLILNKLFHRAFFVAKRVRTETKIANQAVSVSYAAVELAKKIMGDLRDKKALLIGAGEMSELAAKNLLSQGIKEILVTNRTYARAEELAAELHGRPIPFNEFPAQLKEVDIIISSTGSSHYIVQKDQVQPLIRARRHRPMFFIDIAVPRDIDPQLNEIDNIYVYDIDDLQNVVEENKEERKKEIAKAENIIQQGQESFQKWLKSLEVVPTILDLRQRLEKVRQEEISRTLSLLRNTSAEEREIIDLLTQSIINKIIHQPITFLKSQNNQEQGKFNIELFRKIFGLAENNDQAVSQDSPSGHKRKSLGLKSG